jgi:hypothetical protein
MTQDNLICYAEFKKKNPVSIHGGGVTNIFYTKTVRLIQVHDTISKSMKKVLFAGLELSWAGSMETCTAAGARS